MRCCKHKTASQHVQNHNQIAGKLLLKWHHKTAYTYINLSLTPLSQNLPNTVDSNKSKIGVNNSALYLNCQLNNFPQILPTQSLLWMTMFLGLGLQLTTEQVNFRDLTARVRKIQVHCFLSFFLSFFPFFFGGGGGADR